MIDEFEFDGEKFTKQDVTTEVPDEFKTAVKRVNPVANQCLSNAYLLAEKTGVQMVEGYMVTAFHDTDQLECVGHVWNQHDKLHFDISEGLINNNNVKSNTYFPKKIYLSKDAFKQAKPFPSGPLHLLFSTNVKDKEKKVRDQLNSKS